MTNYYEKKGHPVEITSRTIRSSPSISRLFKHYKSYILNSVHDTKPIMTLEKFYWAMKKAKEIPTSRIYEKYLRRVIAVETGLDPNEVK